MRIRIKVDNFNRVAIPKRILDELNIKDEAELTYSVKSRKITISPPDEANPIKIIKKRLATDYINGAERTFLEELLKLL